MITICRLVSCKQQRSTNVNPTNTVLHFSAFRPNFSPEILAIVQIETSGNSVLLKTQTSV